MATSPPSKRDSDGPPPRRRARVEEFEPRVLLSADSPWAALDATLSEATHEPLESVDPRSTRDAEPTDTEQHSISRELVFVDAGIDDYETLVEDLLARSPDASRHIEVVVLDSGRDGIAQISEALAGRSDLDAVHVVSHGTDEGIQLGGTWLSHDSLDANADSIAGWADGLSDDADLLLYGCNLAAGADGKALIEQLATLTGADVAASIDATGAALLGGDWDLEVTTGAVESRVAFDASTQSAWSGVLDGAAVWAGSGQTTPETSNFDGTSFGGTAPTVDVGNSWLVIAGAEAPTRDERIVVGVGDDGRLSGMVWDGTSWSTSDPIDVDIPVLSHNDEWSIDVTYESLSGDALVVWSGGVSLPYDLAYSVWDGSSFSTPTPLNGPVSGEAAQIRLASNPNSDEIVMVVANEGKQTYAHVWDGSSWDSGTELPFDDSADVTDVNVAYEQQSGHAMVVYGNNSRQVQYEIWNGSSWGGSSFLNPPGGTTGQVKWTSIAADPNSDRFALAVNTDKNESWLAVWDGSAWDTSVVATTNSPHTDRQAIAVAFESTSGEALAAYATGADRVRYRTWSSGGGWSGQAAGPDLGSHPDSLTLDADPTSNSIMLSVVDQQKDVTFAHWDGSGWASQTELETNASTNKGQPFLFLWDQGTVASATLTADASAGGPYVISEGGTLDLDGSSSFDPGGGIVGWEWDVGNDGSFEKTGVNASYSWAELIGAGIDDDGIYDVALRVTDDGGFTNTQVFTLTVDNAAPTITATGAASVDEGAVYTLNLSAVDPGDDTIVGWTINWGDGSFDTIVGNPPSVSHVYTQAGFTRNISVSARDEDGTWTNSELVVGSYVNNQDQVFRFEGDTGSPIAIFASSGGDVDRAYDAVVGPDGNFYVTGYDSDNIVRYDAAGNYLGEFIAPDAGGLSEPDGLVWGPDGNVYVSSYGTDEVLRFDASGNFIDVFGGGGPMDGPSGLAFGPDGDLYVASWDNGRLVKIDGVSGGTPTTVIASGLGTPEQIAFGPDGALYIATGANDTVARWDGSTLTTYFSSPLLNFASGVAFGPDGKLYVSSNNNARILSFDGSTTEEFVLSGAGGLNQPVYLNFTPAQQVFVVGTAQVPVVTSAVTDEDVQSSSGLVIDRNAADGPEVTHFKITNISNGTLYQSDGSTLIAEGDFISFAEANAGLRFTPDPDYSGPASFDVQASTTGDDTSLSTATTASISVLPANDAPVLTPGLPTLTGIDEDDTGNAGDLVSAILGTSVSDVDASSAEGIAIAGLTSGNGTWEYSTDGGSVWTAVGLVDPASALLLRSTDRVRFVPDGRNADFASFAFVAWDQTTGAFGTKVDARTTGGTSAFSVSGDKATITVDPVNDAPTLDSSGTMTLTDVAQDNANPPGNSIASIVSSAGGDRIQDVDTGAVEGVAVVGVDDANGSWEYSTNGGSTWTSFVAAGVADGGADDTAAVLLASDALVRFVPDAGYSGPAGDLSFRAWDQTSGSTGDIGVNVSTNGDTTAFSTATETATLTVTAAGGISNLVPGAQNVDEDGTLVFSTGNGNSIIIDDGGAGSTSLRVALSVSNGSLSLATTAGLTFVSGADGTAAMTVTGTLAAINTALEGLTFTPTGDYAGSANLQISTSVSDPAGHYSFDNPGDLGNDDSPGGSNDGSVFGAVAGADVVPRDSVLTFDGNDAVVITGMFGNPSDVTLAAWVKMDAGFSGDDVINLGNNVWLVLDIPGDGVTAYFFDGSSFQQTTSGTFVAGTGWHHVAYTFDDANDEQVLYIDGTPIATTNHSASISYTLFTDTYLGFNPVFTGNLHGSMDDARIYDRSLTPGEIAALAADAVGESSVVDITVDAVNDEPAGMDASVTTDEDMPYVFQLSDFGFSDPVEGDGFQAVVITSIPGVGTLSNGATVLSDGDSVSAAAIFAGDLIFTPAGEASGAGYASFTFQVQDTGGTANSGVDLDTTPNTMTIDVTAINDAPSGADATVVTVEDGAYVFGLADFGFSDVRDGHNFAGVVIASGPGAGTLRDGATVLGGGDFVSAASILAGDLTFTPVGDASGAGYASFTFQVKDDGGTPNGGQDLDATPNTITIDVTPENDAPDLNPFAPVLTPITEDDTANAGHRISDLVGSSISDSDVGDPEGIAITSLTSGNGAWEYSLNDGATWISVPVVNNANALLLRPSDRIRFVPDGRNATSGSFDYRAWDQASGAPGTRVDTGVGGGTSAFSSGTDTASIAVSDVNDAPVLDDTGDPTLDDVTESDPNPGGDTVAAIIASAGGDRITDVDLVALEGIAVVGVDDTNGTWQYSTDGGAIWTDFGTVSDGSALLLDETARIRFVPDVGYVGSAGDIQFRAWDQTTGSNGLAGVDVSANGGITANSFTTETATLNVGPSNAAPVLNPGSPSLPTVTEDEVANPGELVSTIVGGSISDTNSGALEGIAINSLASSNGRWEYSLDAGASWSAIPNSVSDSSALLLRGIDRVRFVPDAVDADAASFDFRAWDQTSGTTGSRVDVSTNGGQTAFSTATDAASITVTAVNDAPSLGSAALAPVSADTLDPPGAALASLFGGGFSDVDPGSGFAGIAVIGNSADRVSEGVWEYSSDGGVSWFAVGGVGDDASALTLSPGTYVRFVPVATFDGSPPALMVRGLDDTYAGGFSSTAGGSESRANFDTSTNGGVSEVSGTSPALTTSVTGVTIDPETEPPVVELPPPDDPPEEPTVETIPDSPEDPPEEPPADPVLEEPVTSPSPDTGGGSSGGVPRALVEPVPAAAPEPVSLSTPGIADTEDREDDDHIVTSTERTAFDVLTDIYMGRSSIDGGALASLIFQGQRDTFLGELDAAQEDLQLLAGLETRMVGSTVAVTSGLSVGYVLWLTRGGLLMASLLSSLPAWRLIDPIPILAHLGFDDEEDEDRESLDSLVSDGAEQLDARAADEGDDGQEGAT